MFQLIHSVRSFMTMSVEWTAECIDGIQFPSEMLICEQWKPLDNKYTEIKLKLKLRILRVSYLNSQSLEHLKATSRESARPQILIVFICRTQGMETFWQQTAPRNAIISHPSWNHFCGQIRCAQLGVEPKGFDFLDSFYIVLRRACV